MTPKASPGSPEETAVSETHPGIVERTFDIAEGQISVRLNYAEGLPLGRRSFCCTDSAAAGRCFSL